MKKKLTVQEYVVVASMLFGLFFGAGNLIFPVHMGQMAGSQLVPATLGFLITGVGLPLLSVAALGISKSEGLFDLSRKVSRPYAYFFTCLLYLTIGPFFAIPRDDRLHRRYRAGSAAGGGAAAAVAAGFFSRVLCCSASVFALPRQNSDVGR